jgi:hypothetical protein
MYVLTVIVLTSCPVPYGYISKEVYHKLQANCRLKLPLWADGRQKPLTAIELSSNSSPRHHPRRVNLGGDFRGLKAPRAWF